MIIRTQFETKEYAKICDELSSLGINYRIKRRTGTNDVQIIFDADVDEAQVRALVRAGIKKHRFKNKESYDDLGLENYTPEQINNYIENNVTNLADVKRVLKIFARIILYLVKHLDDDD